MSNSKTDLRRLKSIIGLLKTNSHIQSIEVVGESIKVVAQPTKAEAPVKAIGALKPSVAESPAVDEYTAFMHKLNKEFGVPV